MGLFAGGGEWVSWGCRGTWVRQVGGSGIAAQSCALFCSGDVMQPLIVPDHGCWEGIRVSALLTGEKCNFVLVKEKFSPLREKNQLERE